MTEAHVTNSCEIMHYILLRPKMWANQIVLHCCSRLSQACLCSILGNALKEMPRSFTNLKYLSRKRNHFLLFGRSHLCILSSLKRHTRERWRHLEIQYLPHLLTSKQIYLNPVITMWITMYPLDDALIERAPRVTALEASIQQSQRISCSVNSLALLLSRVAPLDQM